MYYRYLYHGGKPKRDSSNTLECVYTDKDSLNTKFVTYNNLLKRYRAFDNIDEYLNCLFKSTDNFKCYQEVIFGHMNQKLKFDIDIKKSEMNKLLQKKENPVNIVDALFGIVTDKINKDEDINKLYDDIVEDLLNNIINSIKDTFFMTYFKELETDDILLTTSNRVDKYSYHIIINNYAVENNEEAREFTLNVCKLVDNKYKEFLDVSVNKCTQNFRLLDNQKANTNAFKRMVNDNELCSKMFIYEDTIITNTNMCEILPKKVIDNSNTNEKKRLNASINDSDIQHILQLSNKYTNGLHYFEHKENKIFFRRYSPSNCLICNRVHDNDNTLILTITYSDNKGNIYAMCRRNIDDSKKYNTKFISQYIDSFELFNQPNINEIKQNKTHEKILHDLIEDVKLSDIQSKTMFDILPDEQKNIYCTPTMRLFENVRTLCVHARMKMGKTKNLLSYIDQYHTSDIIEPKILFISFRQTFSSNIKEKFPDFILYSDVKGTLKYKKLIVQGESLHRISILPGTEAPDLLILDESESIFEQFNSGLFKKFNECFSVFQWLLRYSKKVIAMDAYMSDRTYSVIKKIRGGLIHYHKNEFKNAINDKYYFTYDKLKWTASIYKSVENNEKIAIPVSSLAEAELLYESITTKFPYKQVKCYSSKSSIDEKKEHFNNVNDYWSQYDVLIYTPTVSAGVSFEKVHFDKLYAYFTDRSCNVETCLQMMGRIRDVGTHEHYICLNVLGGTLPTNIEDIKNAIYDKRASLFREYSDNYLQFEYNENGNVIYNDSDYFYLWLENRRIRHLSINNFAKRIISYIYETGAEIHDIENIYTDEELEDIIKDRTDSKESIEEYNINKIVNSKDLDDEEIEYIQNKLVDKEELTVDEKYSFNRYKLRKIYNWNNKDLTKEFVKIYNKPKLKNIYKNLCRINMYNDVNKALKNIQKEERESYKHNVMQEDIGDIEINRIYTFDKHRISVALLKLCGFDGLYDEKWVSEYSIGKRFRNNERIMLDNMKKIMDDLIIKRIPNRLLKYNNDKTDTKYVRDLLKPINNILEKVYGIRVMYDPKDQQSYYLSHNKLFTLYPDDTKPCVKPLCEFIED